MVLNPRNHPVCLLLGQPPSSLGADVNYGRPLSLRIFLPRWELLQFLLVLRPLLLVGEVAVCTELDHPSHFVGGEVVDGVHRPLALLHHREPLGETLRLILGVLGDRRVVPRRRAPPDLQSI